VKDTLGVEVGSRWIIWRGVRRVEEFAELPHKGPGLYVRAVREGNHPETGKPHKPHWTDWFPLRALVSHGEPLAEGAEAPKEPVRSSLADAIKAEMPKVSKRPMTPKRRAQNRVTSLRYKIKHPEKHGRSKWSKAEVQELANDLAEAEAELEALR